MTNVMRRSTLVASVLTAMTVAAPAFACGGPRFSGLQVSALMASMFAAPILAALLVDRGAFALGTMVMGIKRRHAPTLVGPFLALAAILGTLAAVSVSDVDAAVVAFSVIPVAAIVCGLSFVRSVIIEQRGNPRAQALRVAAVVGFSVVALAASM